MCICYMYFHIHTNCYTCKKNQEYINIKSKHLALKEKCMQIEKISNKKNQIQTKKTNVNGKDN